MQKKLMIPWLLLGISAVLYPFPFLFPKYVCYISFIYLVPLFYACLRYPVSFVHGYFWGCIALLGHDAGVFLGLYQMAAGPWYFRIVPIFVLVLVRPLFAGIWFMSMRLWRKYPFIIQSLCVTCSAWLYELWMDYYHLSFFCRYEGYLLLNPLIPFAEVPPLLWLLPVLKVPGLLLYLCICSAVFTAAYILHRWDIWLFCCMLYGVWLLGFFNIPDETTEKPGWLSQIGIVQQTFSQQGGLSPFAQLEIYGAQVQERYPTITTLIFPESCLHESMLPFYYKRVAHKDASKIGKYTLVCGGFYHQPWQEKQHNTAYYMKQGTLHMFHKRHAMPLTEQLPGWLEYDLFRSLYFSMYPEICPSLNIRPLWIVADMPVVPYICSELFFYAQPDVYQATTILALCNDLWAPPSVAFLMYLGARFRAQEWQRDILYVSYHNAAYCAKNGQVYPLQVLK